MWDIPHKIQALYNVCAFFPTLTSSDGGGIGNFRAFEGNKSGQKRMREYIIYNSLGVRFVSAWFVIHRLQLRLSLTT